MRKTHINNSFAQVFVELKYPDHLRYFFGIFTTAVKT
jgi:hypothetical protein